MYAFINMLPNFLEKYDKRNPPTDVEKEDQLIVQLPRKGTMNVIEPVTCKVCQNVIYQPLVTNCCRKNCCTKCIRSMIAEANTCTLCAKKINPKKCFENKTIQDTLDRMRPNLLSQMADDKFDEFPHLRTKMCVLVMRSEIYSAARGEDVVTFFVRYESNRPPSWTDSGEEKPAEEENKEENKTTFMRGYRCSSTQDIKFLKNIMIHKFMIDLDNMVLNFYCQGELLEDHITFRTIAYRNYQQSSEKMIIDMTITPKRVKVIDVVQQEEPSAEIVEEQMQMEVEEEKGEEGVEKKMEAEEAEEIPFLDVEPMPMLEAEAPKVEEEKMIEREITPPPDLARKVLTSPLPAASFAAAAATTSMSTPLRNSMSSSPAARASSSQSAASTSTSASTSTLGPGPGPSKSSPKQQALSSAEQKKYQQQQKRLQARMVLEKKQEIWKQQEKEHLEMLRQQFMAVGGDGAAAKMPFPMAVTPAQTAREYAMMMHQHQQQHQKMMESNFGMTPAQYEAFRNMHQNAAIYGPRPGAAPPPPFFNMGMPSTSSSAGSQPIQNPMTMKMKPISSPEALRFAPVFDENGMILQQSDMRLRALWDPAFAASKAAAASKPHNLFDENGFRILNLHPRQVEKLPDGQKPPGVVQAMRIDDPRWKEATQKKYKALATSQQQPEKVPEPQPQTQIQVKAQAQAQPQPQPQAQAQPQSIFPSPSTVMVQKQPQPQRSSSGSSPESQPSLTPTSWLANTLALPKYPPNYRNARWPRVSYNVERIMKMDFSKKAPINQFEITRALEHYYLLGSASRAEPGKFLDAFYKYEKPPPLDDTLTDRELENYVLRQQYEMKGVVFPQMSYEQQAGLYNEMFKKQSSQPQENGAKKRRRPAPVVGNEPGPKRVRRPKEMEVQMAASGASGAPGTSSEAPAPQPVRPLKSASSFLSTCSSSSSTSSSSSSSSSSSASLSTLIPTPNQNANLEAKKMKKTEISAYVVSTPLNLMSAQVQTVVAMGENGRKEKSSVTQPPVRGANGASNANGVNGVNGEEQKTNGVGVGQPPIQKPKQTTENTEMIDALTMARKSAQTLGKTLAESMRRSGPSAAGKAPLKIPTTASKSLTP